MYCTKLTCVILIPQSKILEMIKKGIGVNSFTLGKRKADELLARPSGMPSSKRSVETPPERYCVQHQRDLQYIKALLAF